MIKMLLILALFITGCTNPLKVETITTDAPTLIFVRPTPVVSPGVNSVTPTIITPETVEMLEEPYAFYGYTLSQQLIIEAWILDLIRYIEQQGVLLDNIETKKEKLID